RSGCSCGYADACASQIVNCIIQNPNAFSVIVCENSYVVSVCVYNGRAKIVDAIVVNNYIGALGVCGASNMKCCSVDGAISIEIAVANKDVRCSELGIFVCGADLPAIAL